MLSNREAVQRLAAGLIRAIFEGGGFEDMVAETGLGMMARPLKPTLKAKAEQSITKLSDDQAEWMIDQIHQLSAKFEELTGNYSDYH